MAKAKAGAALVLLALLLVAACGGSGKDAAGDEGAREALASVKPLPSAQVDAALRIAFDNAPSEVGDRLELTFKGPLRNNGPDKLPSLDWKVAFSGLTTRFTSRVVSTGDNFFINLGGQDFEAGKDAIAQLTAQSRAAQDKAGGRGLAAVGVDPLAATRGVRKAGEVSVAGTKTTRYTGAIDLDGVLDQYERLSQSLPTPGAAAAVPQGQLTPEQRAQVKRSFGSPRFEADVAEDKTIRRLVIKTRFTTPPANRQGAGGITGGRIEYRLQYSAVGAEPVILPPEDVQPIGDFARELQRLLSRRQAG